MQLTLLIPGLTWLEKENIRPIFQHISLPGLNQIARYAKNINNKDQKLSTLYQNYLSSCKLQNILPRYNSELANNYLLVSPIQLTIHSSSVTLHAPDTLNISACEAQQFCDSINTFIAADHWQISPITPTLWLLITPYLLNVTFTPLWDAVGFLNPEKLAQGKDRNKVEKIATEIQMLLSTHPVNKIRAEQNISTINSIWFWSLPSDPNETGISFNSSYAWQQATSATKAPSCYSEWQSEQNQHPNKTRQTLVLNELLYANKTQNLEEYLNILIDLDQRYFLPAWQALKAGTLKTLTLASHGHNGGQIILKPAYTRFFWRKQKKFNGTFNI